MSAVQNPPAPVTPEIVQALDLGATLARGYIKLAEIYGARTDFAALALAKIETALSAARGGAA